MAPHLVAGVLLDQRNCKLARAKDEKRIKAGMGCLCGIFAFLG
jgi:hypothetical protein